MNFTVQFYSYQTLFISELESGGIILLEKPFLLRSAVGKPIAALTSTDEGRWI